MRTLLFILALIAGASFYATHWIEIGGAAQVVWKGSGVALLALWAASHARRLDGWLIAAVLALGALGDVMLETHGLTIGALAFLAGHIVAVALYLRNRERPYLPAIIFAFSVVSFSVALTVTQPGMPGIALYALGLGAMAGAAGISSFPKGSVLLGALLFVVSDLLIFSQLGPLRASALPGLLIWPTYFGGQALIAWGVVTSLAKAGK